MSKSYTFILDVEESHETIQIKRKRPDEY